MNANECNESTERGGKDYCVGVWLDVERNLMQEKEERKDLLTTRDK